MMYWATGAVVTFFFLHTRMKNLRYLKAYVVLIGLSLAWPISVPWGAYKSK